LFYDIRFWLILFFILRLFNINYPIFDSHNWRQSDGYAIARNFLEINSNILYPRIDHAGELTGIMGSEFPIMNYLVFWLFELFGVDWWQGRLLNLVTSTIGCFFFYKIIHQFIKKEIAFNATLFLICSIWFAHSRKFMPDVFSTSLVITSVYFAWQFLKNKKGWLHLNTFIILFAFGLLSKLPAVIMGTLLIPAIFDKTIDIKRKTIVVLSGITALLPAVWWYFIWAPNLTSTYGYYYFFMGSSISESLSFLTNEWQLTFSRFYYDALHFVGFTLYLFGGVFLIIKKEKKLLLIFSFAVLVQIIFMLKGGETFTHHSYYIIPFVPIVSMVASYGVSEIKIKWLQVIFVIAVMAEGILNQQHDFMSKPGDNYKLKFEQIANTYTSSNSLIATNYDANPSALYFAHRKGWSIFSQDVNNDLYINSLIDKGCELIIWDNNRTIAPNSLKGFKIVEKDNNITVYKVKTK
jgi:4-amino-4-deoxy-L-arabinose transferase-like glycosyltransferase